MSKRKQGPLVPFERHGVTAQEVQNWRTAVWSGRYDTSPAAAAWAHAEHEARDAARYAPRDRRFWPDEFRVPRIDLRAWALHGKH